MNNEVIKTAVKDAERFIRLANNLILARGTKEHAEYDYPKEQGAMKRASLDLTRSLAAMRKPN